MIYTITDEQIKQFGADRFDDKCSRCAFYSKPECLSGDCVEGCLRYNITPLKQEHFSKMSTETLCLLIDVMQSEVKNREVEKRKQEIDELKKQYQNILEKARELNIDLT